MERRSKRNGWCTQLEKSYILILLSAFCDVNAALSVRFSDWADAIVRLAEHEKNSCHLEASLQRFEAEQKLTKGCSLD